jgi:diguanylate cyclase (GGDEF)-like protein
MGAMLLALVLVTVGGLVSFLRVTEAMNAIIGDPLEELRLTNELERRLYQAMMPPNDYLIHGTDAEREGFVRLASAVEHTFDELLSRSSLQAEQRTTLDEAQHHWHRAQGQALRILAIAEPVGDANGAALMENMDEDFERAVLLLDQLNAHIDAEIREQQAVIGSEKRRVAWLIAAVLVGGIGIAIGSGVALARAIFTPLGALEAGAREIGAGNLEYRLTSPMPSELRPLSESFNRMAEHLQTSQLALRELSVRDALTGLYNRREYTRRLGQEIERCRRHQYPFSVLLLDLDHFKSVNDRYGHDVGDEVLRAAAQLVRLQLRPADFVARYGGEEFIAILPDTAVAPALAAAERVRAAMEDLVVDSQRDLHLTVSIGVAGMPDDASEAPELLKAVDIALYQAKSAGRNRVRRYAVREMPAVGSQ